MALFRPTTVSYHRPDGRKCGKSEAMDGEKLKRGFTRKKSKCVNWYGQFRDHAGVKRRIRLCPDKEKSRQLLHKAMSDDTMIGAGLLDPHVALRSLPLAQHVDDFVKYLSAKGDTEGYVNATGQHVRKIAEGCNATNVGELTADRVMGYLAECRRLGTSASTSNHYLRSVKGFTAWLAKSKRAREDALKHLSALNTATDRRRIRRAISDAEFSALLDAARAGEAYRGLDGEGRYVLYLLAAGTGYRCGELASVTPASFNCGKAPTLTVEAGYSKRRRRDEVPLNSALLPVLAEFLNGKEAGERVFSGWWMEKAAEMLRNDLQAARAAWIAKAATEDDRREREESDYLRYRNAAGHVFDFHALRGQFITFLARAGVGLTTAQKLARHSTPVLTANVYTHLGLSDLAAAVESVTLPISSLHPHPAQLAPPLALANVG